MKIHLQSVNRILVHCANKYVIYYLQKIAGFNVLSSFQLQKIASLNIISPCSSENIWC